MPSPKEKVAPRLSSPEMAAFVRGNAARAGGGEALKKATVYLDGALHTRAKEWAARNRTSLSAMATEGIELVMKGGDR